MTKVFGFCLFRELKLVLVATSTIADGPTYEEYAAALSKFFHVSKIRYICVLKTLVKTKKNFILQYSAYY